MKNARPVSIGQSQIQQDGIVVVPARKRDGFRAGPCDTDLVAVMVEQVLQAEYDIGIVIDDQHRVFQCSLTHGEPRFNVE